MATWAEFEAAAPSRVCQRALRNAPRAILSIGVIGSAASFTAQDTIPVTGTSGQIVFQINVPIIGRHRAFEPVARRAEPVPGGRVQHGVLDDRREVPDHRGVQFAVGRWPLPAR